MNEIVLKLLVVGYLMPTLFYLKFMYFINYNEQNKDEKNPYWICFIPVINATAMLIIVVKLFIVDPIKWIVNKFKK